MVLTWGQGGNGKQAWFMLQVFPAKNNTLEPPHVYIYIYIHAMLYVLHYI